MYPSRHFPSIVATAVVPLVTALAAWAQMGSAGGDWRDDFPTPSAWR